MRNRNLLSLLCPVLVLSLTACSQAPLKPSFRGVPRNAVNGSFKIEMSNAQPNASEQLSTLKSTARSIAQSVGCDLDQVDPLAWEDGATSSALASSFHVSFKGCQLDGEKLERTLAAFSEQRMVSAAEAEAKVQLKFTENDPGKSRETYLPQINRDEVCDMAKTEGRQVIVAVVDSGVDRAHPDLQDAFLKDAKGEVIGANFVGKGSQGAPDTNWDDQNGHGSHVSGIIAATGNNKAGITGIASCANVKIMPVRVMDANGSGTSIEIDRGIQWAIAKGADVINLSLGSDVAYRRAPKSHPSAVMELANEKGVVVFAAAGNEALKLGLEEERDAYVYSYPASYDHVISVAAVTEDNVLADFSNFGDTVDIAAPGTDILSTFKGHAYQYESGTSMASPVAAAAYALAVSVTGRKLSTAEAERILPEAVTEQGLEGVTSGGVIDAAALVKLMQKDSVATEE